MKLRKGPGQNLDNVLIMSEEANDSPDAFDFTFKAFMSQTARPPTEEDRK